MSELSAVKARLKVRSQIVNEAVDWVDFKLCGRLRNYYHLICLHPSGREYRNNGIWEIYGEKGI